MKALSAFTLDHMPDLTISQVRLPTDLDLALREQAKLRNRSKNLELEIAARLAVAIGSLAEAEQRPHEPGAAEAAATCRQEVADLIRLAYGRDTAGLFLHREALRDLISSIPSLAVAVNV